MAFTWNYRLLSQRVRVKRGLSYTRVWVGEVTYNVKGKVTGNTPWQDAATLEGMSVAQVKDDYLRRAEAFVHPVIVLPPRTHGTKCIPPTTSPLEN